MSKSPEITTEKLAEGAIAFIRDSAKEYSKAKAERVYIEQFRKSKKAILIIDAPAEFKTMLEKESYAYSHIEYLQLLDGLKAAVEKEEELRYRIESAKLRFEKWRTDESSRRAEFKQYGN